MAAEGTSTTSTTVSRQSSALSLARKSLDQRQFPAACTGLLRLFFFAGLHRTANLKLLSALHLNT
jgi:hypothetical protein